MAKVRVSDLAKTMRVSDKDLMFKLQSLGVEVESSNSTLDPDVIVAILQGKKLTSRPKTVIVRDEKAHPVEEKKRRVVRPPRPIIAPPAKKEEPAVPSEAPAPGAPAPIIPEFIQAAEQEAIEQERAARELKDLPKPKRRIAPKAAPQPPAVAEAPEPAEPAARPATAPP
ncbi:MAG TPA: translation initiation factor IF-2 N-terminal domain-containing protein, partial [Thermoanaerobaculia bacterium]